MIARPCAVRSGVPGLGRRRRRGGRPPLPGDPAVVVRPSALLCPPGTSGGVPSPADVTVSVGCLHACSAVGRKQSLSGGTEARNAAVSPVLTEVALVSALALWPGGGLGCVV